MSKEPKRNVYVGHRYVPLVIGEWDKTETYEGLSIVTNKGTSYTSKKRVPKGIDILNEEYWVVTGNYNAQIDQYRQEVQDVRNEIGRLDTDLNKVVEKADWVDVREHGAVGDGVVNDSTSILQAKEKALETGKSLVIPFGTYTVDRDIDLTGIKNIEAKGTIQLNNDARLIIGDSGSRADPKHYQLDQVLGTLIIQGVKNAQISVGYTPHLLLYADGSDPNSHSSAYNSFYLGRVDFLEFNSVGSGWINENKFFGGRLTRVLIGGEYSHNHNIFYGPTMERVTTPAEVCIEAGTSNLFLNVRWEGAGNIVYFSSRTWDNVVQRSWTGAPNGYQQGSYRFGTVEDYGKGNIVSNMLDQYYRNDIFYEVSLNNLNFNTDYVVPDGNDLNITFDGTYSDFYDSGLFKPVDDFTVEFSSDSPLWRMYVTLYDEEGSQITNKEVIEETLQSFKMSLSTKTSIFQTPTNREKASFVFKMNPNVKYVSIKVAPHSSGKFNYMKMILRSQSFNVTTPTVPKILNELRGKKQPDFHTFDGTFSRNLNTGNGVLGWSYSNGAWHEFKEYIPLEPTE